MSYQLKELGLSKTVEMQVVNNLSNKIKFDLNETQMDNALVHGVSFLFNPFAVLSPSNKPLFPFADMLKGFLTLVNEKNGVYNASLPLELFFTDVSAVTLIHPKMISLRNSYIEFPRMNLAVVPAGGCSIVATFYYELYDSQKHQLNSLGELIS